MVRRSPAARSQTSRRRQPAYAVHDVLQAVLEIVERNTTRIARLEDVFALDTKERIRVKADIDKLKAMLGRR